MAQQVVVRWPTRRCVCAGHYELRVPLYPRNSREAHCDMLSGTDCVVVVSDESHAASVLGLEAEVVSLRHVFVRDAHYESWLAAQDATDPLLPIDGDDWYVIRHSGGTTGKPKGVGYSHHDWVLNCRNWAYSLERMRRDSVIGHAGPISHASGYLFLPAWLAGAANLLFGVFEPAKVVQTEAVPLSLMGPEDWFATVPGSVPLRAAGRVVPYALVEIRDEDGKVLPCGEEGEIVAKVEGQMRGYWGDEQLTAARLVDGWVHTQDIGRLDTNGYLYVLDRADDMIVSGGFNIWPAELETVIADHPAVVEVAVFAIPHERWGETPMAVVTVENLDAVTADELIESCSQRLGSYKKPGRIELTTEPLPKSVVGKLLRKQLREPYWAGHDRRVSGA
jgi:acyl-CoA synthetase (AMP-forming)/AMP-acid ligase II